MGCKHSKAAEAVQGFKDELDETERKMLENSERRRGQTILQNMVHEEFRKHITDVYDLSGPQLGKGGFGTVQCVTSRDTGKKYAMKTIELSRVKTKKTFDTIMREVEIMKYLDHPNIVRLQQVYQTPQYLFLVMDLCEGGSLLEAYTFRSEAETAGVVRKVVSAIRYCHERNVAHRDLKLENVLYETKERGSDIKVVDFGLSSHFEEWKLEHDIIGTWIYMAPEVIHGSHFPTACDMWSIGVITYLLLCGYPPFSGDNLEKLKWQIQFGKWHFHPKSWGKISPQAKNFIKRLLVRHPMERMTAAEAQRHPWLHSSGGAADEPLDEEVMHNILHFRNMNLVKKLALEVVARTLDTECIKLLEREFRKADSKDNGQISSEQFHRIVSSTLVGDARLRPAEVDSIFSALDVSGTGMINFNDFLAAAMNRKGLDDRRLHIAFDRLDFDGDGLLSVDDLELTVGRDVDHAQLLAAIAEVDCNKDGMVNFEEFCAAMRRWDEFSAYSLATLSTRTLGDMAPLSPKQLQQLADEYECEDQDGSSTGPTAPVSQDSFGQRSLSMAEPIASRDDPEGHTKARRASLLRSASNLTRRRSDSTAGLAGAAKTAMRELSIPGNGLSRQASDTNAWPVE